MCQWKWYRYSCGHLFQARDSQDGQEYRDVWVEGQDETNCANFDANADYATEEVDSKCQECEYLRPSTSSDSSNSGDDE